MQPPVLTIDVNLVLLLGSFGVITYMAVRIRDMGHELSDLWARHETDNHEIIRLSIQLAALQHGAYVSDELAGALNVDAIHEFGANGGVKTYIMLAGDRFGMEDLQDIAFRLGVDFDTLPGDTKSGKAREMVRYMVVRNRLSELRRLMNEMRPGIY
jgi:hypothetical protein